MASHKLALAIDADYFAFRAASAAQRNLEWEDGIVESYGDLNEAKKIFEASMGSIRSLRKAWADVPLVQAFTDKDNWRKSVWPTYKSNRSGKPSVYGALKAWIMETYPNFERPGLEGDDCLGILATKPSIVDAEEIVIVSPDKDFNTIPGKFLWWDSFGGRHEFKQVTPEQADRWHLYQALMGDATDGYPGCPGCGPGGAQEVLDGAIYELVERVLKSGPRKGELVADWRKRQRTPEETLWAGVVSAYKKAGLTEEDALVQARVARILRASDFDFKTKQPILWEPTAGNLE